jgi:predicted TIM-barrel fold metal-dependent hydrolase
MKTPWGDVTVADAHVHFLSHTFFDTLATQKGASVADDLHRLGMEAPDLKPAGLARRWSAELDRHGVQTAVLIASVPGDESSVSAAVQAFPKRFYGYFMLDPTQPDALTRVASALDAGLRGICFFPAMQRYSMHDDRVLAVLESIAEHPGVAAFVHCGMLSVGIRAKLGLPSRFDMRFSNPLDVHAIALRFPRMAFVIPHFGAGFFREALMLADLCPNVYLDSSSSNRWMKYQWPVMDLRDAFRQALDIAGPHRLLFGTDSSFFPRGWIRQVFQTQVDVLYDLGVEAEDAEAIFGANLRRMLTGA